VASEIQLDFKDPGARTSVVLFALGVARVDPGEGLPASVLVDLLEALGLSPAAARAAILRARRKGWLISRRQGRRVAYTLSPAMAAAEERRRAWVPGSRWDHTFHVVLHEIPERHRSVRDALRRSALLAGYGVLHSGLLVAPTDRRDELGLDVSGLPEGCRVLFGELRLAERDARDVASRAWDLEALAGRYRRLARALRAAATSAARRPPSGRRALVRFAAVARPFYDAIRDDPGLPDELLPAGWPGPELSAGFAEVMRCFAQPLDQYLRTVYEATPPPMVVEP